MADEKISRLVDVAKMYYQLDYSQQEIAKKLGISRPTVSRLLLQAVQEGVVHIKICDPAEDVQELAMQVKQRFQLKHCIVASIPEYEDELIKEKLGEVSAEYLHNIVQSGDTIGITWGTTLYQLVKKLQPKNVKDITIVQLNGGVSYSESNTYASEIVNGLAFAFQTSPHFLPVPVVGETGEQSTLMHAGYFLDSDIEILRANNTVGDICSRFIDIDGQISHEALNDRTIGIELSHLAEKEYGILIAGGNTKVDGIYGAIRGRHANILITDQYTAKALLEMG